MKQSWKIEISKTNNMNLKNLNIVIQVVIYATSYNKARFTFNISSAMHNLICSICKLRE